MLPELDLGDGDELALLALEGLDLALGVDPRDANLVHQEKQHLPLLSVIAAGKGIRKQGEAKTTFVLTSASSKSSGVQLCSSFRWRRKMLSD
jgi:hypothetical protein